MLLQLSGITKRFGGVTALRNGQLTVASGEVHLLLGENGAGKSTLMRIVAGMLARDGGEFHWRGRTAAFRSPAEASREGIAMVHQESLLAPHLSIAENLFLGREPVSRWGWVAREQMRSAAAQLIERHRFPLRPDAMAGSLSPAGKQLVEICRAIQNGSSLLIFDEPTSSLSATESEEVFRIVRELRDRGMGVIYITHRLEELRAVGDRVTILRDGETVHSGPLAEVTSNQIIQHMAGRSVDTLYHREPCPPGETLLDVEGISRGKALRDITFSVRAGEIVGLAGLIGAGRTELCRAIFGIDPMDGGRVRVRGRDVRIRTPRDAVAAGIALIPEDRGRHGLARDLPIRDNVTLPSLRRLSPGGWLRRTAELRLTAEYGERLRIRMDDPLQLAGKLSGGNQQKVVIAKWVMRGANIYLFDEPTRGIDVNAKLEVFRAMDDLARSGAAVLMISSETPELLQVADRILVMRQGRMVGELPRTTTQQEILRRATLEDATAEEGS